MAKEPPHLNAEACWAKAAECREQATALRNPSQRIMLEHMAETWERLAKTYEGYGSSD
jgi:hypothetical protein